jgi:hypothetical protein
MKAKKAPARKGAIRTSGVVNIMASDTQKHLDDIVSQMVGFYPENADLNRMEKDIHYRIRSVILGKDYLNYSQIPAQVFADVLEYVFFNHLVMYQGVRVNYESVYDVFFNSSTLSRFTPADAVLNKGIIFISGELDLEANFYGSIDLYDVETDESLPPEAFTEVVSVPETARVQKGDELVFTSEGIFRFEYLFVRRGDKGSDFTPEKVFITPVTNEKLLKWVIETPRMPLSILFKLKNKVATMENDATRHKNQMAQQSERILGILTRIHRHEVPATRKK